MHRDWSAAIRVASVPASFQPLRINSWSHEDSIDRNTTETRFRLYTRIFDVEPTDRALIDGVWWEIDGDPGIWDFPLRTAHMKLVIRRVTG